MSDDAGQVVSPDRRRRVVLMLTALLVVLALGAAVLWWSGYRASAQVIAHAGPPRCQGTEPTTYQDQGAIDDEDLGEVSIPLRRGFACTVPIRVENLSDHEVTLQRLTLSGGPDDGSAFRVHSVDGVEPSGDDLGGAGAQAVAEVELVLGPGEEEVLRVRLVFGESGCTGEGGWVRMWPQVRVADQLARHDVAVAGFPRLQGTADSDCGPSGRQRG
ncbi:hypothetical protein ACFJIY_07375 [Pimelobacter simplex]|uniref:hypothetical protein n=1 Tax=Nocardioides simplex TaxID=2045 RepID=UPI0036704E2D